MDVRELWATYADHVARLFRNAPSLTEARGESWFAVLTHEYHTDLNQCVLAPGASPADVERIVGIIEEAHVPAVVSVTPTAADNAAAPLSRASLLPMRLPEPVMWCETKPERASRSFLVERVTTEAGLEAALSVCASGHSIDQVLLSRLLMRDASRDDSVSTWLAWDGEEPVSVVWLTHGERIGVWEMMTPPEHRRRGAGRAVLSAALADSWTRSTEGAFLWASPAGRPLYESLGFRALDEPQVWVTEGWDDANAAVGQPA